MTFAEKLKELRESNGFTKKRLAEESGTSQQAIVNWELGTRVPAFDAVQALCKALGVKLSEFEDCEFKPASEKQGRGRPKKG